MQAVKKERDHVAGITFGGVDFSVGRCHRCRVELGGRCVGGATPAGVGRARTSALGDFERFNIPLPAIGVVAGPVQIGRAGYNGAGASRVAGNWLGRVFNNIS